MHVASLKENKMNPILKIGLVLYFVLGILSTARAEDKEYYMHNNKKITKVEALKTLIQQPQAVVIRCQQLELSEKATLVKKK
jgi:hypothetical protein